MEAESSRRQVKAKAGRKLSSTRPPAKAPEESSHDEEDEDEENGGVGEKGMKRLMELVNADDLDEFDRARLDAVDGGADEEDDGDASDEDAGLEGLEYPLDGDLGGLGWEDDEDGTSEGEEVDEEAEDGEAAADAEVMALDDLDSDISVDEDAVPTQKVTTNNRNAMKILTEAIRVTHLPWPEHLVLSTKEMITVDPSDDLEREMAFYKMALDQIPVARKMASKHNIPFSRPNDYYAEMVKSDEHMERVRTKLVNEATGIQKSEAARKQRDLKKFGKQIQVEKLKERQLEKRSFNDRMAGIKRKRKEGMDLDGDDEFGIELDDTPDRGRGASRGRGGKPKVPRHVRDAKFSLGGGGRRSKQNTRESANDFAGWSRGGRGGSRGGGRGGSRGGRGGSMGRGGPLKRLGKARREKARS